MRQVSLRSDGTRCNFRLRQSRVGYARIVRLYHVRRIASKSKISRCINIYFLTFLLIKIFLRM